MNIKGLQKKISDALNGLETLVQGGCKAFAEDTMGLGYEIGRCLNEGGVSVVVVTPRLQRNGDRAGTLPMECTLAVQCTEKPALNREAPGHLTALDAAEIVAHALDGEQFCLVRKERIRDELLNGCPARGIAVDQASHKRFGHAEATCQLDE